MLYIIRCYFTPNLTLYRELIITNCKMMVLLNTFMYHITS